MLLHLPVDGEPNWAQIRSQLSLELGISLNWLTALFALWVSTKLQTIIATSTTLWNLNTQRYYPWHLEPLSLFRLWQSQFWRDYEHGKKKRSQSGRHTPCSKFYSLKLHWFWHWVKAYRKLIVFVDTKQQKADFLTKAMTTGPFQLNQSLSMGWW